MARITAFEAGYCTHLACMALRGAGWRICKFPARAYLIDSARGRWLFDTGYASHFLDHTRSGLFAIYRRITPVHFNAEEAVAAQLAARGLGASDLSAILLSHFHGDHVAGLRDFPGTPVICSGAGWRVLRTRRGLQALRCAFVPGLMPPDFEQRLRFSESLPAAPLPAVLAPFGTAREVPGAGGEILLVELPGHALGHLGALVQTDAGWTLLAADAAWSPQGYSELRLPALPAYAVLDSAPAYLDTLRRLQRVHATGGVTIRLSHEGAL